MDGNQRVGWFVGWGESAEIDEVSAASSGERERKGKPCGMTWIAKHKRCRINDKINAIRGMAQTNPNGRAMPIGIHTTKVAKDRYEAAGAMPSDFRRYSIEVEPSTFKHVNTKHGTQNIDYGVIPMLISNPDTILKGKQKNSRGLTFVVAKSIKSTRYEAIVRTSKGQKYSSRSPRITITTMYITKT